MKTTITLGITLFLMGTSSLWAQWNSIADFPAGPTDGACSFFIDDKLYVGGGAGNDSFYELDTQTDSWTKKADIPGGVSRGWAIGFSINGTAYVGGGDIGGFNVRSDFYRYTPETDEWNQIANFMSGPIDGAYTAVVNGKAYIIGGFDGTAAVNEVWEYDPESGHWYQKADYPGGQAIFPSGFVIGDKIYVGTGSPDGFSSKSDFYEYTPATDSWVQKADFPGVARQACVGFTVNNIGYMGGGESDYSTVYTDFYSYDVDSDSWTHEPALDFPEDASLAWSTAAVLGQNVYLGTGANFNGGNLNFSDEFYKKTMPGLNVSEHQNTGIDVYPNPAKDIIHINMDASAYSGKVSIKAISGQLMYESTDCPDKLDISFLPKGLYIISFSDTFKLAERSQLIMRY